MKSIKLEIALLVITLIIGLFANVTPVTGQAAEYFQYPDPYPSPYPSPYPDPFPYVMDISRWDTNPYYPPPSNPSSVMFRVRFTEDVTGVDTTDPFIDFVVTTTGISGAAVISVSGLGRVYMVEVGTGTGNGTIRLDVKDDDSIVDSTNNLLGGLGEGNGDFTDGEVYIIERLPTPTPIPGVESHARDTTIPFVTPNGSAAGMLPVLTRSPQQAQSAEIPISTPMPELILPVNTLQPKSEEVANAETVLVTNGELTIVDELAPEMNFLAAPEMVSNQRTAFFTYESDQVSNNFMCSLDGSAYTTCGNSIRFTGLSQGLHVFDVRTMDETGNLNGSVATFTWVIHIKGVNQLYMQMR